MDSMISASIIIYVYVLPNDVKYGDKHSIMGN
jgi:hypothetical protein